MGRGFEPLRGHKRDEVLALHHAFLLSTPLVWLFYLTYGIMSVTYLSLKTLGLLVKAIVSVSRYSRTKMLKPQCHCIGTNVFGTCRVREGYKKTSLLLE